jgi:hypothetical protein
MPGGDRTPKVTAEDGPFSEGFDATVVAGSTRAIRDGFTASCAGVNVDRSASRATPREVRDAARGLRARIDDINRGLANPKLGRDQREALQRELGVASRNLDAAKQALQGEYRQHAK